MKTTIKNFVETQSVDINGVKSESAGNIVSILQRSGSVHFQFSMTPNQARTMAEALHFHADQLEKRQ